jgi:hypothetical protein
VVTVFTSAAPVRDSLTDVSLMVQEKDSSQPILDASVDFVFTPPAGSDGEEICGPSGAMMQGAIPASHQQASNKLLYAAPLKFGVAGNWRLEALIKRGNDAARLICEIPVGLPTRRLVGLLPYLALPLLAVVLFAINQYLSRRSLRVTTA